MFIDPSNQSGFVTPGAVVPLIAAVTLTTVILLCACLNTSNRRKQQTYDANDVVPVSDTQVSLRKIEMTAKDNNGDAHQSTTSVVDPVDTCYDTIGNVANGNSVVRRDSKPVTPVVSASSSEGHGNSGPSLPPRNSDAHLLGNGFGILTLDQHLDDHRGNIRTAKGDYSIVNVRLSSGRGLPGIAMAIDDTYEDVDRLKVAAAGSAAGVQFVSSTGDMGDDTYEAVDQIGSSLHVPSFGHQNAYSPSSSMHYEAVDMLQTSTAVQDKLTVVPYDDYEPIPGSEGRSKSPTMPANNVLSTFVPPASISDTALNDSAMPVYAAVDKSKKTQTENKPVARNISELYAKVSKPKKSAGNQTGSSQRNSGPENGDQSTYPCLDDDALVRSEPPEIPVFQSRSVLLVSGSNKPREAGYDTIDFGAPSSPDAGSHYDNMHVGELAPSKEPMYEEMATVLSKVDQSNSGLQ